MPKIRYLDDDDGPILRDGEILRVSMMARDAARSISVDAFSDNTRYDTQPARATIVDELGRSDPMHLRRPGSRFLQYDKRSVEHAVQQTLNATRQQMYDDLDAETSSAWRSPNPGAYHISSVGNLADAMPVNDAREQAYIDYDNWLQNAWRRK